MSKELIEQLRELSASRKPYATGAHGQIIGMESYRIVANGFALECIDEAADRIEELEQDRDQLRAQINVLREALTHSDTLLRDLPNSGGFYGLGVMENNAEALASIPEQSLAEYRNKVIEDCAITIENCEPDEHGRLSIQEIAEAVSAMKEQP